MRRLASYIDKYGPVDGPKIYRDLQSHSSQARWKVYYRARLHQIEGSES